jgi:hypothetical protein
MQILHFFVSAKRIKKKLTTEKEINKRKRPLSIASMTARHALHHHSPQSVQPPPPPLPPSHQHRPKLTLSQVLSLYSSKGR